MFARASCAILLAVVVFTAAPAHGENESTRHEAAKALMRRGGELYAQGAYADALKSFRAAYELLPNPKIWFNVGQAALKLDDEVVAANAFSDFLDHTLESADLVSQRRIAREHLSELGSHLARVRVEVHPAAASVRFDGHPLSGRATFAAPGPHEISATADGFAPEKQRLEVRAAELRSVPLQLQPLPSPPVATAPPVRDVPPPSAPAVAAPPVAALDQPAPAHRSRTAGWVLMGTGGAALAASVVFGVMASTNNSMLTTVVNGDPLEGVGIGPGLTRPGDAANELRSRVSRNATISTVALGVGVVAAGVGLFFLLRGDPPAAASPNPAAISF